MKLNKKAFSLALAAAVGASMILPLARQAMAEKAPEAAKPVAAEGAPAAPAAPAEEKKLAPDTVVLTIGDEKITAGEFDEFIAGLPPEYQQAAMQDKGARRMLAEELVKVRVVAKEARKRGIDKDPKVKRQLALIEEQVLFQSLAREVVNEKSVDAYLEEHKADYVTARHILVSTRPADPTSGKKALTDAEAKAKADAIRARLVKGEDFAAAAKADSDDPGSKDTGGVYTFGKGQMVKEFEQTAFSLKEGELSEPVKTDFGYHIIQRQPTDMTSVKPQLSREVGPKKMEELVKGLRKGVTTELNPDYFGAALPVPPVGPEAAPAAAEEPKK